MREVRSYIFIMMPCSVLPHSDYWVNSLLFFDNRVILVKGFHSLASLQKDEWMIVVLVVICY